LALWGTVAAAAPAERIQLDLPRDFKCVEGGARLPAVVMVPGSGPFDRDVDFGTTGTEEDYLFRGLADEITRKGLAAVRFDYRGVREKRVDPEVRKTATIENVRDDIEAVYRFAARESPCIDPERIVVLAHSEGTIHVAHLIHEKRISPKGLLFIGLVARSPKELIRWQSIDPAAGRCKVSRAECEAAYDRVRAEQLARPDDELIHGFWPMRYWKFWWRDEVAPLSLLAEYPGRIIAHGGTRDTSTPGPEELDALRAASLKKRPKTVIHKGKGHSLGEDTLKGPMSGESRRLVVKDVVRLALTEDPKTDYQALPYFGITFNAVDPHKGVGGPYAFRVLSVLPGFPAWEAGLRPGDLVLRMNDFDPTDGPRDGATVRFMKKVQKLPLGSTAVLKVVRTTDGDKRMEIGIPVRKPRAIDPGPPPAAKPELEQRTERMMAERLLDEDWEDLKTQLKDMTVRADAFRLPEVNRVQHYPFTLGEESRALVERLARAESFLENRGERAAPPPFRTGLKPDEHLAQLREALEAANHLIDEAFSGLSVDELATLRRGLPGLFRKFEEWNYVYADSEFSRLFENLQVLQLASRVRLAPLALAARGLFRAAAPAYLAGLRKDLRAAGRDLGAEEVASVDTPFGRIRISGTGSSRHLAPAAIHIDLGGDDVYGTQAGGSSERIRAAAVIDVQGDDTYETAAEGSQGAGFLGVGLLADLAGRDTYVAIRAAQGSAMAGAGLLFEGGGDDTYRAQSLAQGASFIGIAGLFDEGGNDRYAVGVHGQGTAIAGGAGVLYDRGGNDDYVAMGAVPSGYETPGTFSGWSQGTGVGIRFLASGGIGILHDGGGKDRFQAGDFSQGGGYWFGWGIFDAAGAEDDVYLGTRYAQGFSAHAGLGAFFDHGGNDLYDTRALVITGAANDLGIAWFEDLGRGRDRYRGKDFSLGASANNSISVFRDGGGANEYPEPAQGQVNDYRGGTSLSYFIDLAAGPATPWEARDDVVFLLRPRGGDRRR
jgi:hypothetical protein